MEFNLYSDRSLTPTDRNRGVENENKSQLLCIYIQDKTLLDKKAFIEFKTDSEERYITERLTISEDGEIVYQLLNGLMQTEYLQFQVIFTDDYNWVWKSVVKEILIQNSINTADQLAKEYPDFISNAQEVLSQVEEVAETVVEKVDEIEETVNEYTQRVEQVEQTVEEYTQAEESRVQAENLRVANETQRIANENSRLSSEQTRVSNESARQTQETTRQANESTRQSNEVARSNAETTRSENEASRVSAESQRATAEGNRASAETLRVSQESTRQTNESSRVNAEALRAQNETTRENNEVTRGQNEATRIANEEARVQAETDRATEFATWEDEIDSKADKDYVDKKDTNLQYEIADLKAKLYETVVGVKQLKTEYASEIDIPTHITEDSVAYPVLDNTAIEAANIKGHTLKWNQLHRAGACVTNTDYSIMTYNSTNDSYNVTVNIAGSPWQSGLRNESGIFIEGHKILIFFYSDNASTTFYSDLFEQNGTYTKADKFNYKIGSFTGTRGMIGLSNNETGSFNVKGLRIVDLTPIFGAGNEPTNINDTRVQWAIAYATKHPEYDAGSLKNVNVEKIESFTANAWDEEWEVVSGHIESKNFVSVKPNTQYYFYGPIISPQLYGNGISLYDVNKNFLSRVYVQGQSIYTIPNGCRYIKFALTSNYGTTYNHDISIYKGSTNLGYIPSKKLGSLTPPNIDLRGINNIQDTLEFVEQENGTYNLEHTKYVGRVDLGSRIWAVRPDYAYIFLNDRKSGSDLGHLLSKSLPSSISGSSFNDGNLAFVLYYNSATFTTSEQLQEALKDIMLYYELATPVKTVIATGLLFDEVSLLINKYGRIEVVNRSSDNVNADTTFNVAVKEFKDE